MTNHVESWTPITHAQSYVYSIPQAIYKLATSWAFCAPSLYVFIHADLLNTSELLSEKCVGKKNYWTLQVTKSPK